MPELTVIGSGRRMTIFKEVGRPDKVAERFGLGGMAGSHAIGHTRMATEFAVTTTARIPSPPGPTSAWCTTARFRTTMRSAVSL